MIHHKMGYLAKKKKKKNGMQSIIQFLQSVNVQSNLLVLMVFLIVQLISLRTLLRVKSVISVNLYYITVLRANF